MIQVYVISLLAEELRRSHILKECNQYGLNPTVIDAVDMRNAGNREVMQKSALPLKKSKRKQRRLSRGETGCALSHQAVYRKFLAGTESYALILEDDAEFIRNPAALLQENVLAAIQLQYQFDVLLLGYVKKTRAQLQDYFDCVPVKKRASIELENGTQYFGTPWKQYGAGAVAYIVSRQGAEKLITANALPCVPADDYPYFEQHYGLRVLHSRPAFALESALMLPSTIGNRGIVKPKFGHLFIRVVKGRLKNFAMNRLGMR